MNDPLAQSDAKIAAAQFVRQMEYQIHQRWWLSLRCFCGVLVYRHAIEPCPCGMLQSEAYAHWKARHADAIRRRS